MKCIHCNKEGVSYDGVSEMFFCKECGSLYDTEEHEQYIRNKGKIKIKEDKPSEVKGLSVFSHIILNTIQSIPLIGLIIPLMIGCSEMPGNDKKFYAGRFISQFLILSGAMLVYTVFIMDSRELRLAQLHDIVSTANNYFISASDREFDIDERDIPVSVLNRIEPVTLEPDIKYLDDISMFDGATVKGSTVLTLVNDIALDDRVSILVQTKQIASRYSKTTYRNYGLALDGVAYKADGPCYIKTDLEVLEPLTDDYGRLVHIEVIDLDKDKSIFKISEESNYSIQCFYEDDILIALVVKELK